MKCFDFLFIDHMCLHLHIAFVDRDKKFNRIKRNYYGRGDQKLSDKKMNRSYASTGLYQEVAIKIRSRN
jgi:hypothetical protein